jgi:hypothetical protein
MKRILVFLILCAVIVGTAAAAYFVRHRLPPSTAVVVHAPSAAPAESLPLADQASAASLAPSLRIAVPFSPQAPSANWDALHEEACEEMSLIMAMHYWKRTPLTPEIAEQELQSLVEWEHHNGYKDDVTMEELTNIAVMYYDASVLLDTNVTAASIKNYLRQGRPIIVPAAGRMLGNPYFSGQGPWYHALLITGYENGKFITNDPGTKRGENYEYDEATLLNAIHDWAGKKEDIAKGGKAMVVVDRVK